MSCIHFPISAQISVIHGNVNNLFAIFSTIHQYLKNVISVHHSLRSYCICSTCISQFEFYKENFFTISQIICSFCLPLLDAFNRKLNSEFPKWIDSWMPNLILCPKTMNRARNRILIRLWVADRCLSISCVS